MVIENQTSAPIYTGSDRINSVLAYIPGYFLQLNSNLSIYAFNGNIEKLLKTDGNLLKGQSFEKLLKQLNFGKYHIKAFQVWLLQLLKTPFNETRLEFKHKFTSTQEIHYFEIVMSCMIEEGKPSGILIHVNDITKNRSIMRALRRSHQQTQKKAEETREYLETIIGCMPGYVFWMDKNRILQGCNDNEAQILHLNSRSEIVGKTYKDIAHVFTPSQVMVKFQEDDLEVLQSGIPKLNIEDPPFSSLDNQIIHTLTSRVPIFDKKNNVIGLVGISVDITDLKRAKEEAEIANQAKSEFLACMSHDLRTPLNGILGIAQILMTTGLSLDQTEYVANIIQAGNTLLQIIEDILSFSRIEAGKFELSIEPFNFRQLIEEIIELLTLQAKEKNIKLYFSYAETAPYYVIGDPHCARRILINLIDNAIKFTESGYILVSVEPFEVSATEATLQIVIEDTGIGIPSDKLDYIFERFNRLSPSYRGRYKGTGLGLTIVKQLIASLGGHIQVNSQPGKGSTFWFELPFKLQNKKTSFSNWTKYYNNIPILFIDDNAMRAELIIKQLSSSNGKQVDSSKALDALSILTSPAEVYKIIIIDDEIISSTPLQLAAEIRNNSIYQKSLLILSANPCSLEQVAKAKKAGFHSIFTKTMQPGELLNKLTFAWESWMYSLLDNYRVRTNSPIQVLLVEDDFLSQKITQLILEDMGCTVAVAGNGKKALSVIDTPYLLMLVDIGLPDIDGLSLTEKIRNGDSINKNTTIVALTAHVMNDEIDTCIKAGMNYFMKKPLMKHELLQILVNILPVQD